MKRKIFLFTSAEDLAIRIAHYFIKIQGEYHMEEAPVKPSAKNISEKSEQKVWDREPEPATLSGLALHLGFESRQAFELHEAKGKFSSQLKRARLQIESEYEKKLHYQSSTGAIFALKSLGWHDKSDSSISSLPDITTLKVEVIETGPAPANAEQQVSL